VTSTTERAAQGEVALGALLEQLGVDLLPAATSRGSPAA
jgi:hypothetical protein